MTTNKTNKTRGEFTRAPHNLRFLNVETPDGGLVQIVELSGDRCHVGFRPTPDAPWQHWGAGVGGYAATCARFRATDTM